MELNRRRFLQTSTASLAAGLVASASLPGSTAPAAEGSNSSLPADLPLLEGEFPGEIRRGDMLYRPLGRTGENVSLVGIGGAHLSKPEEEEAIRIVRSAIDAGVNFMDNCWDYSNGKSEERMGRALRDGYRDKVFLMTKIDGRTRKAATAQLDDCLRRLQTDRVDLLQHHEIIRLEDGDVVFAHDGANEAIVDAQKAGKVRFIGFTGHKDPLVHLRMLEVARERGFRFDAAQFPLNIMDAHFRSFARTVVPALQKEGMGILGMKPMGGGFLLKSGTVEALDCLQYAMSLPVSTVITGVDRFDLLAQTLDAVKTFRPLERGRVAALLDKTRAAAARGEFERYKISAHFDGTAKHPEWLG